MRLHESIAYDDWVRPPLWAIALANMCARGIDDHLCRSGGMLPKTMVIRLPKRAAVFVCPTVDDGGLEITAFYRPQFDGLSDLLHRLKDMDHWTNFCAAHLAGRLQPDVDDWRFSIANATVAAEREIEANLVFWDRVLGATPG